MAEGPFRNIARLFSRGGEDFRGCGVLIAPGYVVTSTMAWGYYGQGDPRPDGVLDLPLLAREQKFEGTTPGWHPADTREHEADFELRDIAVIALSEPAPSDTSFPSFADPKDHIEQAAQIMGFYEETGSPIQVTCRVAEAAAGRRMTLEVSEPIPPGVGFLGAPVVSDDGVLGIVVGVGETAVTAIPSTVLAEAIARVQAPETWDPLIDRLAERQLVVSTLARDDQEGARQLLAGAERWGFGPEIDRDDIVMIYFPKALANSKQLEEDVGAQSWGLRFLLQAADASTEADPSGVSRQIAEISKNLELSSPVNPDRFTTPPLSEWGLAKRHFQRAGQERRPLPDDLARALWSLVLLKNPEVRPKLWEWVAGPQPQALGISTHATSDLWTTEDKLGYRSYARAIHNFLQDSRTEPPLTISIQAPWGGGKTSLMRMVQEQLDPLGNALVSGGNSRPPAVGDAADSASDGRARTKTRQILDELRRLSKGGPSDIELDRGEPDSESKAITVWFNAWRYQSSDQIWAGLAESIIRGVTDRLAPVEREIFLLRLHLSRINPDLIRTKIYDAGFRRFLEIFRWAGPVAFVSLLPFAAAFWRWVDSTLDWASLPLPATLSATILTAIGAVVARVKAQSDVEAQPATHTLSDYVEVPDYSEKLGFIHHVTEDLRRVFELLPKAAEDGEERRLPLVIFIDDLDRCAPQKVAEVFEAINLFVAGEFPNCYIIIGMDTEVVAAALEEAHKSVIERLPGYARRVPVGWRFMDKFVQLPFVIPPLGTSAVENYADYLAASEDVQARKVQARALGGRAREAEERIHHSLALGRDMTKIRRDIVKLFLPDEPQPPQRAIEEAERLADRQIETVRGLRFMDERSRDFNDDSERIKTLLFDARDDFSNNPRELKRLANVYRFYFNLRLARLAQSQSVPTEAQLEDWLKFSLAWPEVVRWLRRSDSEWESAIDPATADMTAVGHRFSRLEDLATEPVVVPGGTDAEKPEARPPTVEDWADALAREFGIPREVPWLRDERLFNFIRSSAARGAGDRLSDGAGKGFW